MIIITLSVHFLAKVLDNSEKLEKEFAFSIGFLILSLTAYIYLSRCRSEENNDGNKNYGVKPQINRMKKGKNTDSK